MNLSAANSPTTDAALEREKEELLALLLAESGIAPEPETTIPARHGSGPAPLSFAQQRLWFLEQLGLTPGAYNMPLPLQFTGPLDVAILERCLTEIRLRHEALRTCFRESNGEVLQHVQPAEPFPIPVIDLSHLDAPARQAQVRKLAAEETARPFDLAQGPLIRARLLRLCETDHILLLTIHHIASDGWSVTVLMRELSALYAAFTSGQPSPLAPLPVQYADYSIWQRERLNGDALKPHLDYWRKQLAGVTGLELPADDQRDDPRPAAESSGASQVFEISSELTSRILSLAAQHDVTPYIFLLAVFQLLLHRYTGETIVPVGSPIANRDHAEIEPLIGFFVNSLVLSTDLGGDPTFTELLGRVRDVVLGAFAHQEVPFEKLVEDLQPERKLNQHPLFQISFAMQQREAMLPRINLSNLEIQRWAGGEMMVRFDLELHVWLDAGKLFGICMYNPDLYAPTTVNRLTGHFRTLLSGVVANPSLPVSALPLLTERERQEACISWNDTARQSSQGCLHTALEAQAAATPDAIAAIEEDSQLTYRALNERANQLAHHLRALGVGPEVACGLCIERSLDMLIAVLAVLKTGGAYVPIDPSHPRHRTAFLLQDAAVQVLLTASESPASELAREGDHAITVVSMAQDANQIAQRPRLNPANTVRSDNLAYVLYTSGSTGQPKGVMMSHGGLMHYLAWCREAYNLNSGAGTILHSSLSFDLSITALLAPLLVGNRVRLLREARGVEELERALLEEQDLTLLKLTPAHLEVLGARLPPHVAGRVRTLIVGGEALTTPQLDYWRKHAPATRVVNEYGPTEAAVGCAVHIVPAGELTSGSVPIGHPISNMQLYIANQSLQLAPANIPGELYIAGAGLARGYLNRPELTAASFLPNPFSATPGQRIYKSGDTARWNVDGQMDFLGRLDQQVKIRGYRVELGEIESALAQHSSVSTAVVLAQNDNQGGKRLAAYVVPAKSQPSTAPDPQLAAELRRHLESRLPEYMIPSGIAILDELPLNANGKVARAALPLLQPAPTSHPSEPAIKLSALEQSLAALFSDLLGIDHVREHDSFFSLGGHSLLAYRLVAKIRDTMGVQIPLHIVFTNPTVAGLARWMQSSAPSQSAPAALPPYTMALQPMGHRRPVFFFPPAVGISTCYAALAASMPPDRPLYGFESPGISGTSQPLKTAQEMATLYADAILALQPQGPYILAGWSFGAVLACAAACELEARGHKVALLALIDGGMRDASQMPDREKLHELFSLTPKLFKAIWEVRPASYTGLRLLGQWTGISLPESLSGFSRGSLSSRWKLLRNILSGSLRALRVSLVNTRAGLAYAPPPYSGKAVLFRTRLPQRSTTDPLVIGVRRFAAGGVELHPAPGSHMTLMLDPRNAKEIGRLLEQRLAQAEEAEP